MHFVPFPGLSSSGDQVTGECTVPGGPCVLITSQSWLLGFPGVLQEQCLRCAMCLLQRADLRLQPSWWMSTIQDLRKTWLAAGSLFTVWWKMPSMGLRWQQPLAFQLWLSQPAPLPLGGEGLVCSRLALLWSLHNPLVCEGARLLIRLSG